MCSLFFFKALISVSNCHNRISPPGGVMGTTRENTSSAPGSSALSADPLFNAQIFCVCVNLKTAQLVTAVNMAANYKGKTAERGEKSPEMLPWIHNHNSQTGRPSRFATIQKFFTHHNINSSGTHEPLLLLTLYLVQTLSNITNERSVVFAIHFNSSF